MELEFLFCICVLTLDYICRAFFGSLYRSLARGARAVLQVYPENLAQRELILSFAMRAGFSGGVVVDFPHRCANAYAGASYLFCSFLSSGNLPFQHRIS